MFSLRITPRDAEETADINRRSVVDGLLVRLCVESYADDSVIMDRGTTLKTHLTD